MPVGEKAAAAGRKVSGACIPLKRTVSANGAFFKRTGDPGILYISRYGARLVVSVNLMKKFTEFRTCTNSLQDGAVDFALIPSIRHSVKKDVAEESPI